MANLLDTASHHPSLALYKRLLKTYVLRYRKVLAIGGACMLVVAGSTALQAWLIQPVLDFIFVEKKATYLALLPIALVVVALANAVADYGQSLALKYVGQRVVCDMQGDLFSHLMHADISLFHDQSTGRLISRLTNDILLMRQSVSQVFTGLLKESVTMVFLVVTVTLLPFSIFSVHAAGSGTVVSITALIALLVCLIPTTIGGLLSAVGVAGMSRMMQANVIATSGRAVEAAGDVDVLLLDKTGTITHGNRQASAFLPAPDRSPVGDLCRPVVHG